MVLRLHSRSAYAEAPKKKRRDMLRRTRGSASLPAPERLGPIISPMHTNDLTLTGNKCLFGSSFSRTLLGQE